MTTPERPEMYWKLADESVRRLNDWVRDRDRAFAARQGRDDPYYGAIGGAYVSRCRVHPDGRLEGWVTHDATGERCDVEVLEFSPPPEFRESPPAPAGSDRALVWLTCRTSLGTVTKVLDEATGVETDLTVYDW